MSIIYVRGRARVAVKRVCATVIIYPVICNYAIFIVYVVIISSSRPIFYLIFIYISDHQAYIDNTVHVLYMSVSDGTAIIF